MQYALIPAFESEPVFCEEHSSCDSWTEGLGTAKASKMVSDLRKGRALSGLQIEAAMLGFFENPGPPTVFRDNGSVVLDTKIAGQRDVKYGFDL